MKAKPSSTSGGKSGSVEVDRLNSRFFDSSCDDTSSSGSSHKRLLQTEAHKSNSSTEERLSEKSLEPPFPIVLSGEAKRGKKMEFICNPLNAADIFKKLMQIILIFIWIFCTIVLIYKEEKKSNYHQISIPPNQTKSFLMMGKFEEDQIRTTFEGAFVPVGYENLSQRSINLWLEVVETSNASYRSEYILDVHGLKTLIVSEIFVVSVVSEELLENVPGLQITKIWEVSDLSTIRSFQNYSIRLQIESNLNSSLPMLIDYDLSPVGIQYGIISAFVVLFILYFLIITEVVHRTLAGLFTANVSVALLALVDERPSIADVASWVQFETLLLLLSMMIIVGIISDTGVFDFLAVFAYKRSKGRTWPVINTLCIFTALLSCFIDNVTTALLMTPTTIRLCEVMSINIIPVLMAMMIYSNLGGAITPVGDPPNIIVISNADVINAGVSFGVFVIHMSLGIIIVGFIVHFLLRCLFGNKVLVTDDVVERQGMAVWEKAAASIAPYSKHEETIKQTLHKRTGRFLNESRNRLNIEKEPPIQNYERNLEEFAKKYPIKNKPLLVKCCVALLFVVTIFCFHAIPDWHLSLGTGAFMGVLLLLILSNGINLDGILARVEWGTLLFFGCLFIIMEALSKLRLIEWVGQHTENFIQEVDEKHRLPVAILLILWISATASAFVDNIPLTSMMIKIVASLSRNPQLGLPLTPLVWALCYGSAIGGIATLIGSSSNVVTAGVADQHGYKITFLQYSKIGVPVMLISMIVISIYLIVCHVVLGWNN